MRSLLVATASALFFAVLVTELSSRVWPGEYFALLLLAFVALLVSGLLNLKLAARPSGSANTAAQPDTSPADSRRRPPRREGNDKPRNAGGDGGQRRQPPPPNDAPRETGTVKWFNRTKGFGFVIRPNGEEIFVHQRSIRITGEDDTRRRPALRDGQTVTFVVADRDKGLQAEDVVPADER
jgi:cold shock CspA family protein